MSGHSKWNNIKNRKGAADAKRSKIFSQIARLIKAAVKEGGSGDPSFNPTLRMILDKARAANMPKENIQRAIDRGLGRTASGAAIEEKAYEAYGPHGIGMVIVAFTENTTRTSANIRAVLTRASGSLGGPNSVMYAFQRTPQGEYSSTMPMELTDQAQIDQLETLIDTLRSDDDVEDVYVAAQWPESAENE